MTGEFPHATLLQQRTCVILAHLNLSLQYNLCDMRAHACLQITIGNNWCTIVADAANREEIALRIAQIKKELSETDSVYDTEKLSERIAKLAGGVAVIKVSARAAASLLCNA